MGPDGVQGVQLPEQRGGQLLALSDKGAERVQVGQEGRDQPDDAAVALQQVFGWRGIRTKMLKKG